MPGKEKRSINLKDSRKLAIEAAKALKYRGYRLAPDSRNACQEKVRALAVTIRKHKSDDSQDALDAVIKAATELNAALKPHEASLRSAAPREYVEAIGTALVLALLVRMFVFEAFHIPTGSMIPTVNISDQMFVNKYKYGLRLPFTHYDIIKGGQPDRGEVVVFDYPVEGENYGQAFLKRIVALPGDHVQLKDNVLNINGSPIPTTKLESRTDCSDQNLAGCWCERQEETLGGVSYTTQHLAGPRPGSNQTCRNDPDWPVNNPMTFGSPVSNKDFPEVVVPEGHVLCMGDNRDNSSDGRYWGFVPIENLRGNAVLFWWPPKKMFKLVK